MLSGFSRMYPGLTRHEIIRGNSGAIPLDSGIRRIPYHFISFGQLPVTVVPRDFGVSLLLSPSRLLKSVGERHPCVQRPARVKVNVSDTQFQYGGQTRVTQPQRPRTCEA